MRKEFKHFTTKKKMNWTEDSNAGNEGWKSYIRHIQNKEHNDRSPSLSVITLVSGLNTPIKKRRLAENTWSNYMMVKIHDPIIWCLHKTHLKSKDINRMKVKGWKMIFHAHSNQKRTEVATLVSHKTDFKSRKIMKHQKDITH